MMCRMNVLGTKWTVCGAPSDGPCMCDVVVTTVNQRHTCPACHNDGRPCFACGAVDLPALGRKVGLLYRDDRPTFVKILRHTQRRHWPVLAHAFLLSIGQSGAADVTNPPVLTEPAIMHLWSQLVKEAA